MGIWKRFRRKASVDNIQKLLAERGIQASVVPDRADEGLFEVRVTGELPQDVHDALLTFGREHGITYRIVQT